MNNHGLKIAIILFLINKSIFGQDFKKSIDPETSMIKAEDLYNSGNFIESISILSEIKSDDLDKLLGLRFHRLMSLNYLMINEFEQCKTEAMKMLITNPYYRQFPEVDPLQLTNYLAQFEITPKVEASLGFGAYYSDPKRVVNYAVSSGKTQYNKGLRPLINFILGYRLKNSMSASLSLGYGGINWSQKHESINGNKQKSTIEYTVGEMGLNFSIPLTIFSNLQIEPLTGLLIQKNFKTNNTLLTKDQLGVETFASQDLKNLRFNARTGFVFGATLVCNLPYSFGNQIFLRATYSRFPKSTLSSSQTSNASFILDNHFNIDEIKLDRMLVSFGLKKVLLLRVSE